MRFFFLLVVFSAFTVAAVDKPNIILLMGDDHGWAETGYYDHPHLKTPVLDEMARTGLRLDHFYAGHPSCSPTRGSFLTGRHPNRFGTFTPGYSIRPKEITMAHLLAKAGYHCGHFGKWHLGPVKKDSPTNPRVMGFHEYVSHDNFYEMNPPFSRNGGPPVVIKGEGSEVTIDETLRFIEDARKREKPFLAVVWFGSPHEPYSGLARDLALYDNLPKEYAERKVRLTSNETGRPTQRPLRDVLRERYAEITAMDRAIGKLRKRLTELNLRDNTVLWYCGDNGSPRSYGRVVTPFREEKGSVYEGGIRVPGLIEWPAKIKKGRVSKVNGVTSDILPTVCEWAGMELPKRPLDGISLAPLVSRKMTSRPEPIGFWSFNTRRATRNGAKPYFTAEEQQGTTPLVKLMGNIPTRNFRNYHQPPIEEADYGGARVWLDNRYKLVIPGKDGATPELYDLQTDPAEKNSITKKKPELTTRMARELRTWQSSVLNSLREKDYPKE